MPLPPTGQKQKMKKKQRHLKHTELRIAGYKIKTDQPTAQEWSSLSKNKMESISVDSFQQELTNWKQYWV